MLCMPSFRKSYKRLLMSSCVILIFVIRWVHSAKADCVINDWPRSCLANFKIGPEKCEPCESGKYGCNCSHDCNGSYGLNCYFICDCLGDQYCHPALGCINVTTTSPVTTQSTSNTACEDCRYGCNCSERCPVNTYGPGCYTSCDCTEDEFCDPVVGCMNNTNTTHTIGEETTRQGPNNPANNISSGPQNHVDVKTHTTTTLKNDINELSSLKIVGISIATLVPIVVLSILVSILFSRRKVDTVTLDKDTKSINADVSETDDQNNDTHSYVTISDKSDRLYAAVHYDEVEDRKSSSPISLRSITEHVSSDSDNSKTYESYLTPLVEAVELKGNSPRSSDYEDVAVYKM